MLFIESRPFTRRLRELAGEEEDDVLRRIQEELLKHPERGPTVVGLGGARKARLGSIRRGKGKRGGYRYLYLYLRHKQHIHLLFLLSKGEQEDLAPAERAILKSIVNQIKRAV